MIFFSTEEQRTQRYTENNPVNFENLMKILVRDKNFVHYP